MEGVQGRPVVKGRCARELFWVGGCFVWWKPASHGTAKVHHQQHARAVCGSTVCGVLVAAVSSWGGDRHACMQGISGLGGAEWYAVAVRGLRARPESRSSFCVPRPQARTPPDYCGTSRNEVRTVACPSSMPLHCAVLLTVPV